MQDGGGRHIEHHTFGRKSAILHVFAPNLIQRLKTQSCSQIINVKKSYSAVVDSLSVRLNMYLVHSVSVLFMYFDVANFQSPVVVILSILKTAKMKNGL